MSTPSSADEELQAFQCYDLFALERIQRARGLLHFHGVNIDDAAAHGQIDLIRLLCEYAAATYTSKAVDAAAANGHLDVVQYLHGTCNAPSTSDAMDVAAENGHWAIVEYLRTTEDHEWQVVDTEVSLDPSSPPTNQAYTTRVLDAAALDGRLDLVQQFHRDGLPCSTWAMDMAAACGHLDVLRFLHTQRHEGCTTRAMDEAARDHHVHVVRFLHTNRTEGCTTNAMDYAAANGDLATVTFLHANRTEGCTTNAIDEAAEHGHAEVVEFLLRNRTDGFTCRAVERAAKKGCEKQHRRERFRSQSASAIADHRHVTILRMLFHYRPDLFDPSIMPALLLCGAFDLWMELRQGFPDLGGEAEAMMLAGERGHVSTIRFLREVEGRRDLLHLGFAGAAHERPSWLTAMYRDDPYSDLDDYLHHTTDGTTLIPTETWDPQSFFLEENIPDWMIEQALIDYDLKQHGLEGDEYPCQWTWPIWAIYRHDMATLEVIRRLEASADYMCDPRFNFDDARSHAIRVGRLDILQWLFTNVPHVAVEPTLLDDAIFYGQLEIAKWLAYHHPAACEEFPGAKAWPLAPLGVRLDMTMLDELENDARLRVLVDFGAIAAYAAEQSNVPLLRRLYSRYPASVLARRDILDRTVVLNGGCCDLSVLQYLKHIGYTHVSPMAMDSATSDSQLTVLEFLYDNYRHGDATLRGLLDAAKRGSWKIVLFHVRRRGLTDAERDTVKAVVLANITEAWAVKLLQLLDAQREHDDRVLMAEWLSDSEQ